MNFHALNTYANAFSELFFPRVCRGCGEHLSEHEAEVCGSCLRSLPRTGFESVDDNLVSQMFWGRVKIEKAASLLTRTTRSPGCNRAGPPLSNAKSMPPVRRVVERSVSPRMDAICVDARRRIHVTY